VGALQYMVLAAIDELLLGLWYIKRTSSIESQPSSARKKCQRTGHFDAPWSLSFRLHLLLLRLACASYIDCTAPAKRRWEVPCTGGAHASVDSANFARANDPSKGPNATMLLPLHLMVVVEWVSGWLCLARVLHQRSCPLPFM